MSNISMASCLNCHHSEQLDSVGTCSAMSRMASGTAANNSRVTPAKGLGAAQSNLR